MQTQSGLSDRMLCQAESSAEGLAAEKREGVLHRQARFSSNYQLRQLALWHGDSFRLRA